MLNGTIIKSFDYKTLVMLAGFASVATAVILIAIKGIVWFFSGSTSIFASLTDSMFDALASFINLLALRYSLTPPDDEHRFGHYKSQSLASLAQAAFIGGSYSETTNCRAYRYSYLCKYFCYGDYCFINFVSNICF